MADRVATITGRLVTEAIALYPQQQGLGVERRHHRR
jgi:hypothetical protein